ncbi:hypothetical protein F5883DRAFT_696021 [Diaporthe sp. PMI_573]|nr:hypothetical protein F5883DRAFT_696021 [Diaporthaceae sp. PMI_573]
MSGYSAIQDAETQLDNEVSLAAELRKKDSAIRRWRWVSTILTASLVITWLVFPPKSPIRYPQPGEGIENVLEWIKQAEISPHCAADFGPAEDAIFKALDGDVPEFIFYRDDDGKPGAEINEDELDDLDILTPVWTTVGHHITHCMYLLLQAAAALNLGTKADMVVYAWEHARHCAAVIMNITKTAPGWSDVANDASSSVSFDSAGTDPQRVVIHGKPYIYKNGKLTPSSFGYLLSTKATTNKFGNNERRREEDCRILRASSPDALEWFGHEAMTEPVTAVSNGVIQPEEPAQVMSAADLEDRSERKRIEIQTRLGDNAWLSDPANNIRLDDYEVFDILYRGEKLAKRCLWRWLRINRPMTSRRFGYLSNMDFGRDTLIEVEYIMERLIWLRNNVHHFDGWGSSLAVVEEHLFAVHRFAVLLYDEEIAVRARILRDRLHQAAEGVAQEIETVWLLTELPFAGDHPWKHHHITLFREVLETRRSDEDWARQKYSPAAFEGAVEFGQRIHVNDMSRDCGPDMEEAWPRFRDWRAVGVDVLINVAQKISRAVLVARLFLIV